MRSSILLVSVLALVALGSAHRQHRHHGHHGVSSLPPNPSSPDPSVQENPSAGVTAAQAVPMSPSGSPAQTASPVQSDPNTAQGSSAAATTQPDAGAGSTPSPSSAGQASSSGPSSGGGLAQILTQDLFNQLKSQDPNCQGASLYTYDALIQAATTLFPAFGTTGDDTARKHDVAGFLAHAMHETGLCFVDEQGGAAQNPAQYCQASEQYPCAPGANYHGRGPLQLTWNYNYIDFGKTLPGDQGTDIYQHPEHISASGVLLFQSALFAYMRPSQPDAMHNLLIKSPPDFGQSIQAINGALECNGGNSAQVSSRVEFFKKICQMLGVDPGNQLTC